jgi:DNA polymerase IV (DinB-like DNA polymerase)
LTLILEKTDQLTEDIHKELLQRNVSFKQVGIIAIMTDLSIHSRSQTLEKPASDLEILRKIVRELSEKFLNESELEIRRVGVKVSRLGKEETEQKPLTSFFPTN